MSRGRLVDRGRLVAKNSETTDKFEQKLWEAADKLRKNIDAAEYKHVVLGLIFLRYISESFEELYEKLKKVKENMPELILRIETNTRLKTFFMFQPRQDGVI